MFARLLALPLALLPLLVSTNSRVGTELDDARAHYASAEYEAAAELLIAVVQSEGDNAAAHELLASSLLKLDRKDEASHHLEVAFELFSALGEDKVARDVKSRLYRTDPYASSRAKQFERITKRILDSAEKLAEKGSTERALQLIDGVRPIATGKELAAAEKLYEQLAAAFEKVDLNAAGAVKDESGAWPLFEASSVRYELACNLEPDVVTLIGETMDSIFDYYVSLYFDGDDSKIKNERATIRIYPTKEAMLGNWQGGSAPEGWWSPGTKEVVSFDTRTTYGSLDSLLETLFHEASHQFMTFMTRGGRSPAWLNEGTSSFFEGAIAMADNRVLWPDAAIGRLRNLQFMLKEGGGPTPRQVIEYSQPASYPGSYYAFGWGYVYYLQQYEDPETLEYVYRPLYAEYRDEVTSKQRDSMEMFEETFLGRKSPRKHKTFEDFEKDWVDWILNEVAPLHLAQPDKRRELRRLKVDLYLAAAEAAKGKKKAKVSEAELLRRALGHLEYIRTRIDTEEAPDPELILQQAGILERLEFKESAAPLLEQWLDLADAEVFEFTPELYEAVEDRLKAIDRKNHELRRIRSTIEDLIRGSRKILAKYEKHKEPMPLRAYTFAASIADVFSTDVSLAADAERLKLAAREAGVLKGVVKSLSDSSSKWTGIFTRDPQTFTRTGDAVTLKSLAANAQINTDLELSGEYEIRGKMERVGKLHRGSAHGIVVGGNPKADFLIAGLTDKGKLAIWQIRFDGGGAVKGAPDVYDLSQLPPTEGKIPIAIHVFGLEKLQVTVGSADPIDIVVNTRVPARRHPGVYVNDGELQVTDFIVELFL